MIVWWNYTKGGIDEYSRMLKNYKPLLNQLGPNAALWIRLLMSGAYNTHHVCVVLWIEPRLHKYKTLEQLAAAMKRYGSFRLTLLRLARGVRFESPGGGYYGTDDTSMEVGEGVIEPATEDERRKLYPQRTRESKITWANSAQGKKRRTTGFHLVIPYASGDVKDGPIENKCALCDVKVRTWCRGDCMYPIAGEYQYRVFLCSKLRYNEHGRKYTESCAVRWHRGSRDRIVQLHGRFPKQSEKQKAQLANARVKSYLVCNGSKKRSHGVMEV